MFANITKPPNRHQFSKRFWVVLCLFFALAFAYELFQWTRGAGDTVQATFMAGFLAMTIYWLARRPVVRLLSFFLSQSLLIVALAVGLIRFLRFIRII